jgi:benzoate/toluate 1,2-dioxygenase reductase subunit
MEPVTYIESDLRLTVRVVTHRIEPPYLYLQVKPEKPFSFKPGQHTQFYIVTDQLERTRHYSIASAPNAQGVLDFCVMLSDDAAIRAFYQGLKVGDRFAVTPAQGSFLLRSGERPRVFVAGGSGIAPIRSMLQSLAGTATTVPHHLVYGCASILAFPYADEFLGLHKVWPGFRAWLCAESASAAGVTKGRVTDVLHEAIVPDADYYLCGPKGMRHAVVHKLLAAGVGPGRIIVEAF